MITATTSATKEDIAFYEWEARWREQMAKELAGKMIDWYILLLLALISINILPYLMF